eukprot:8387_1
MVREILTINIGCAGINLGQTIWKQYLTEHHIDKEGKPEDKRANNKEFLSFFAEGKNECYKPRQIMIDSEPNFIDNVLSSPYGNVYDERFLISGKEDASRNFARGYYAIGKEIMNEFQNKLRLLVEESDNSIGFCFNSAYGGGTGSGLLSLILERIAVDYTKKSKLGFIIHPFNDHQSDVIEFETYNSLLTMKRLIDHNEITFMFDNRQIYKICNEQLLIKTPTYDNMNHLITKAISSLTASMRNGNTLNVDFIAIQNQFALGSLHFLTTSFAPLANPQRIMENKKCLVDGFVRLYKLPFYEDIMHTIYESYDISFVDNYLWDDIINNVFRSDYFMVEIDDFNAEEDKYMSIWINYRGNIGVPQARRMVQQIKQEKRVTFVEWCPTGIKTMYNDKPIPRIDDNDPIAECKRSGSMIANNAGMYSFFKKRICDLYDLSKREFVHLFVAEGMEEQELIQAREDLTLLQKDYLEVLSQTDENESD